MIQGVGVDIVELPRIQAIINNNYKFVRKVLTTKELERFESLHGHRQCEYLAGRFACKEAFSKAYGTGIGKVGLRDIEILTGNLGEPIVTASPFDGTVHVSISHTKEMAIGQIILESDQKKE